MAKHQPPNSRARPGAPKRLLSRSHPPLPGYGEPKAGAGARSPRCQIYTPCLPRHGAPNNTANECDNGGERAWQVSESCTTLGGLAAPAGVNRGSTKAGAPAIEGHVHADLYFYRHARHGPWNPNMWTGAKRSERTINTQCAGLQSSSPNGFACATCRVPTTN